MFAFIALLLAVELDIPAEIVATSDYVTLTPKTDCKSITYIGQSGVEPFPAAFLRDPRSFVLPTRGLQAGRYKFVAVGSLNDEHTRVDFSVLVNPMLPPVAVPVAQPVAPAPLAGMRVLVITETDTPLPKATLDAMNSTVVWNYLRTKALKGPDNRTPEIRIGLDDDLLFSNLSQAWQDLRAKLPAQVPRDDKGYPVPQLAIGAADGSAVFSGAFPASESEALTLFRKYGGN